MFVPDELSVGHGDVYKGSSSLGENFSSQSPQQVRPDDLFFLWSRKYADLRLNQHSLAKSLN